jgi:hypothetical protein
MASTPAQDARGEHGAPADARRQTGEGEVGDVAEEDPGVDEDLQQGGEHAADRRRRDLGGVDGGHDEAEPHADTGDEARRHEGGEGRAERHGQRAGHEERVGEHQRGAAAGEVRAPAGGEDGSEHEHVHGPGQHLDLLVSEAQVLAHEQLRSTHQCKIW